MILPDAIVTQGIALKDQYFDLVGLSEYSALKFSTLRPTSAREIVLF